MALAAAAMGYQSTSCRTNSRHGGMGHIQHMAIRIYNQNPEKTGTGGTAINDRDRRQGGQPVKPGGHGKYQERTLGGDDGERGN